MSSEKMTNLYGNFCMLLSALYGFYLRHPKYFWLIWVLFVPVWLGRRCTAYYTLRKRWKDNKLLTREVFLAISESYGFSKPIGYGKWMWKPVRGKNG